MKTEHYVQALKEKPEGGKNRDAKAFSQMRIRGLNTTESPEPALMMSDTSDPPNEDESWGFHLLINCSSCNDKIDSEEDIRDFFKKLIKKLTMKELTPLIIKKVNNKEEGRGISAFQMITTSHFAMHFDDAKRSGYLDIFSCKVFKPEPVVELIREHFQPKKIVSQMIFRDAGLRKGNNNGNTE